MRFMSNFLLVGLLRPASRRPFYIRHVVLTVKSVNSEIITEVRPFQCMKAKY